MVGADGMRSTVRAQAGIGFRGHEYPESFALADVRLHGVVPNDEVLLCYAPDGLTVVAPLPGGIHRIVAPVPDAPETPSAHYIQQLLDSRAFVPGRVTVAEVIWGSHFRIYHRVADTTGPAVCWWPATQPTCTAGRWPGHEPRHPGRGRAGRDAG